MRVVAAVTRGASLSRKSDSQSGPVAISTHSPSPPPLYEDLRHASWDMGSLLRVHDVLDEAQRVARLVGLGCGFGVDWRESQIR